MSVVHKFGALIALGALAGCSTTAVPPAPPPVPPSADQDPFGFNRPVLAFMSEGTAVQGTGNWSGGGGVNVQPVEGTISVSGPYPNGEASLVIGGATFTFPVTEGSAVVPNPAIGVPVAAITARPVDVNGQPQDGQIAFTALHYAFAGATMLPDISLNGFFYGGWETPLASMPEQLAYYDGRFTGWSGLAGEFSALADFDESEFLIRLYLANQDDRVGEGAGVITGNTFLSSFNITEAPNTAYNMSGTLLGSFYGPGAEEIAGSFEGKFTESGAPSAGTILGIMDQDRK